MHLFPYPSIYTSVLGAQKNCLNEHPKHMFKLRNKKIIFQYTLLSWGLVIWLLVKSFFHWLKLPAQKALAWSCLLNLVCRYAKSWCQAARQPWKKACLPAFFQVNIRSSQLLKKKSTRHLDFNYLMSQAYRHHEMVYTLWRWKDKHKCPSLISIMSFKKFILKFIFVRKGISTYITVHVTSN